MNKSEREDLALFFDGAAMYSTRRAEFRKLLDYVDTLESALSEIKTIEQSVFSERKYAEALNQIGSIIREALDKGK